MSNTPEKIWAIRKDGGNGGIYTTNENISADDRLVEYIRADLVPQWMPIDTAPKDGTWVMGYFPNLGVAQMIWCNDRPGLVDHWMRFGKLTPMDPTHWQPLPNPPPAT